jgi:arginyl-tRNA synthetase
MFDVFRSQCEDALRPILDEAGITDIALEEPSGDFGDLAYPCFPLAPIYKKEVGAVAGYINFYLDYSKMASPLVKDIHQKGPSYGSGTLGGKYTVEHTSANPDGPIHIGHGRNAIIGDSLVRIMRFAGCDVKAQYYLNDMGKQLAVVVWGLERYQRDETKKNDHATAEVYVAANREMEESVEVQKDISELMVAYEAGDPGTITRFEDAANYCQEGITRTLARLDIHHDETVWESKFVRDGSVDRIVGQLKGSEYIQTDDVLSLDMAPFGIEKELVLARSDGTYLYATRDIAHHIWRSESANVIDVWGSDHKLLADQMKVALTILGEEAPEFVIYEFITLPEGSMSTRKGRFIALDDLVQESVERAYKEVDSRRPEEPEDFKGEVAEKVGCGAVRYNIIRVSPDKSMVFRWDEALDFERQGSPFIQYAHARCCRILEKEAPPKDFEVGTLSDEERVVLKLVSRFPEIVAEAAQARRPAIIAHFVLDLATAFHRFYMFQPVLKSEEKAFRLNLVDTVRITLANALTLLGIDPMEKM